MIESSSESESVSTWFAGGSTGGSTASPVSVSFLVSLLEFSLVSPLSPLSIKVCLGGGGLPGGGTACGGATGGGSSSVLVSSVVSPLFPLSIKVLCGNGVPVTRVGLLLRVLADTGVGVSSTVDIQPGCRGARQSSKVFGCYSVEVLLNACNLVAVYRL